MSKKNGQHMLQTSIATVRQHMPENEIHVLYHGHHDVTFRAWLADQKVQIHKHDPAWRSNIEEMRKNGDPRSSHLFLYEGNYFGTWQRIDIPLFIQSEYCLLLDADTVIMKPFVFGDFKLHTNFSFAMSTERDFKSVVPQNAGVTLFNVPIMRQTHDKFVQFILDHVQTAKFDHPSPSDQGAYLDYYRDTAIFLSPRFNYKPYWPPRAKTAQDPFIVHFHGAKPYDYIKRLMGQPCDTVFLPSCEQAMRMPGLCFCIRAFARVSQAVEKAAYCNSSFSELREAVACDKVFDALIAENAECPRDMSPLVRAELERYQAPSAPDETQHFPSNANIQNVTVQNMPPTQTQTTSLQLQRTQALSPTFAGTIPIDINSSLVPKYLVGSLLMLIAIHKWKNKMSRLFLMLVLWSVVTFSLLQIASGSQASHSPQNNGDGFY